MPFRALVASCFMWFVCAPAVAGNLTPPGAPGSTMKTLDEVEARIPVGPLTTPGDADSVYRISQPGSYYLTGDVVGGAGLSGIEIDADEVTLDLNGYTVRGTGAGSLHGVHVQNIRLNVSVRNGVIADWGLNGVAARADGSEFSDLRVRDSGRWGIDVDDGYTPSIRRCIILRAGLTAATPGGGIRALGSANIIECTVFDVRGAGIEAADSAIRDCVVRSVSADGAQLGVGIVGRLVDSCFVNSAASTGIVANTLARGCVSRSTPTPYSGPNIVESF